MVLGIRDERCFLNRMIGELARLIREFEEKSKVLMEDEVGVDMV